MPCIIILVEFTVGLPILIGTIIGGYFASRGPIDRYLPNSYLEAFTPALVMVTSFVIGSSFASITLKGIEKIVNNSREKLERDNTIKRKS